MKRIWLCADDYGISPGVNRAIRDLIERGRLNATSVMVVTPAIGRDEVARLQDTAAKNPRCAIGLHVTLTAPFRPLTMHFRPLRDELFLPFPKLLRAGMLRRLDAEIIRAEVIMQIAAFRDLFVRTPDFVDGHQHVQLYPQVRDGVLAAVKEKAPGAWVRQARRNQPLGQRLARPKALFLDHLSSQFKRKAARAEPVAALYEQGRVHHVGAFPQLEDQMCAFAANFDRQAAGYSPDRVDALVWALTELLVEPRAGDAIFEAYRQLAASTKENEAP